MTSGGVVDNAAHLRGQISKNHYFRGVNRPLSSQMRKLLKPIYYTNYCINSNQILQHDKNHQVVFIGGPNMHQMNRRWRTAASPLKGQGFCLTTEDRILMGDVTFHSWVLTINNWSTLANTAAQ